MRLPAVLGLCFAFLLPAAACAADQSDWYQVEVLVFAQTHPDTSEHWDTTLLPHYDNQAIHLSGSAAELPAAASTSAQQAAAKGAWQLAAQDNSQPVAAMAAKMNASGNYRTLFYGRWQQPIPANQTTLPIYLQGGNAISASAPLAAPQPMTSDVPDASDNTAATESTSVSLPELQGTLTLSRAHYLHLDTNLWFAASAGGQPFFTHIDAPRRLKSGELHYLDNPLFGLLIRLTPVTSAP